MRPGHTGRGWPAGRGRLATRAGHIGRGWPADRGRLATRPRQTDPGRPSNRLILLAGLAALAVSGCGGSSDTSTRSGSGGGGGGTQLALVAYSTPKKAYDALTSAFAQTAPGKGVGFSESFGASGSQSRAVDSGQPADVVAFSTEPDMTRLVKDGIVAPT